MRRHKTDYKNKYYKEEKLIPLIKTYYWVHQSFQEPIQIIAASKPESRGIIKNLILVEAIIVLVVQFSIL